MADLGKSIKIALLKNGLTQRWLVDRLHDRNIPIDETYLSHVLGGKRDGPKAKHIMSVCATILMEHECDRSP